MTTIREYRFDDTSAPVLTGQVGSLAAVLKACLVTGYGSKTAAGWSNPYSGTNIEILRNDSGGGSGTYFQIHDNSPHATAGAREAQVFMFTAMTSATAGSNQTPATATTDTSIAFRKSATADSTARNWWILASEKRAFVMLAPADTDNYWNIQAFGDYEQFTTAGSGSPAFVAGRQFNGSYCLNAQSSGVYSIGMTYSDYTVNSTNLCYPHGVLLNNGLGYDKRVTFTSSKIPCASTTTAGILVMGTGMSHIHSAALDESIGTLGTMRTNTAVLQPLMVFNWDSSRANAAYLGKLPGLFDSMTYLSNSDGAEYTFTGEYAGRTFKHIKFQGQYRNACALIETTAGAW